MSMAPSCTALPEVEMPQESAFFPSDPAQVGAARRFILKAAGLTLADPRIDEIAVCASEVVTNAVLHARQSGPDDPPATFGVIVQADRGEVVVTVTDGGGDTVPTIRRGCETTREHGRGVALVDELSDEWGFTRTPAGQTAVWFAFHATAATTLR